MAEARAITSRCPNVTGSNVPGQIAYRLSGAIDSDQGVAVAALVEQRQIELDRGSPVALGDDAGAGCEHRRQRRRELLPSALAWRYGGSRKTRSYSCRAARARWRNADAPCAAHLGGQIRAPRGCARIAAIAAAAESTRRGRSGAARERLDRQRTRAGEQVEHRARPAPSRGSRTAPRARARSVGRVARPRGATSVRPPESAADHPHARIGARASVP